MAKMAFLYVASGQTAKVAAPCILCGEREA